MNSSIKTELSYRSFDELSKLAQTNFKNVDFNKRSTCASLLKIYDQGYSYLNLGDDEKAYLLLMRFFDAIQLLRKSKLYKEDKAYVDGLINMNKLEKTLDALEMIKASLIERYKES